VVLNEESLRDTLVWNLFGTSFVIDTEQQAMEYRHQFLIDNPGHNCATIYVRNPPMRIPSSGIMFDEDDVMPKSLTLLQSE
jgi:hypothetical protein